MPGLNFFRLYPKQRSNLLDLLEQKGLERIDAKNVRHKGTEYRLTLYFSTSPKSSYVKWIKHLQDMFKVPNKMIHNYSAVILIEATGLLYAVSYGIAHFFISRFADTDFGIGIASRVVESYKMKSSREFGGKTTKSILTYSQIPDLAFDGGESVNYIKGIPLDRAKWGKTVRCGQSVQLRKREFTPSSAHILASALEDTLLTAPLLKEIPRSIRITDRAKIKELLDHLVRDMQQGNYMMSISSQQLSGVEFTFSDMYTYHLQHDSGEVELDDDLSLDAVELIVERYFDSEYTRFLAARVEAREDGEGSFSKELVCFIDYVDSANQYYLDDGQWYQFDSNYMNNLQNAVRLITVDASPEITVFNEELYQQWLRQNRKTEKQYYRERYLNELLARNFGYANYDRNLFPYEKVSVEIADLVKNEELVFVKIGKPQKLNYLIDQSLNALAVLQRSGLSLNVHGTRHGVSRMTLWMFLERESDLTSITEVKSLIFLMKLANWRKEVLLAGLTPVIKISYRRSGKQAS